MTPATPAALATFATGHLALAIGVTVGALATLAIAGRVAWRATGQALRGRSPDGVLTVIAATLTSAVVATGMWRFAGERLHFSGLERVLLFAILEVTVLTCAVRARRNILEDGTAGPEGVAIWLVSIGSGVFAATATTSAPEALFRLALPLLATWLWERSLLPARREAARQSRWHVFTERMLARLGLVALEQHADDEAAARWRIAQLARAVVRAKRASRLTARWRRWRVDVLTVAANERAELATRPDRRDLLLAYIGILSGTGRLIAITPPAPWDDATQDATGHATQATATPSHHATGDAIPAAAATPPVTPPGDATPRRGRQMTAEERATAHAEARRLRAAHPDMTLGQIGERTSLSERTVSRVTGARPVVVAGRKRA